MKKRLSWITWGAVSLVLCVFFLGSCEKDETKISRTEIISRVWIQIDIIASGGGMTQSIFDQEVPPAHQDDLFEFKTNGTFVVTEGATKESEDDPDLVAAGTWQLIDGQTKIVIDPDTEPAQTLTIEELTSTSFKAYYIDNTAGFDVKITSILKAN
jgi:hypothetical protein